MIRKRALVLLTIALAATFLVAPTVHGSTLVVANKTDNTVDLVDLEAGKSVATLPTGFRPHEVAVSPDGTLAVISHDRAFIDALATRVVEVRAGALREFPGNYSQYLQAQAVGSAPDPGPRAVSGHGEPSAAAAPAPQEKRARMEERRQTRDRQRARTRAERRLAAVEAEILEGETAFEKLGWQLGDPEVARDADAARRVAAERDAARERVDTLYKEWERLAAELASLDAADGHESE